MRRKDPSLYRNVGREIRDIYSRRIVLTEFLATLMGISDRDKWDRFYLSSTTCHQQPATILTEGKDLLPTIADGLDIACGLGANSLYLAAHGLTMTAMDVSEIALAKLTAKSQHQRLNIKTKCVNLKDYQIPIECWDVIVVSYFLLRSLFLPLQNALKHNGLLFYQTFVGPHQRHGPKRVTYRLQPNELKKAFKNLEILHYREENEVAMLIAKKPIP